MSSIHLIANEVLFTSYGHLQLVFDPDGSFGNGDEQELEVQGPFLAIGNWDVRPLQAFDTPPGSASLGVELTLPSGIDAADLWDVLINTRTFFATQTIDYRLGLVGALEGQNSNSYITTLSHAVGLDLASAVSTILASPDFSSLPGLARNVLFDHAASNDDTLPPIALDIDGSTGRDNLFGGLGNDRIDSLAGRDTIHGHGGNDTLSGGSNHDMLHGGDGDDTLNGNAGRDALFGGAGHDTLSGGTKNDRLTGGSGNDTLTGDGGSDRLFGNSGDDDLSGGGGRDVLRGGGGRDNLSGMAGADNLTGGFGADVFVFDGTVQEGRDTITDFRDGRDLIQVSGLGFADVTVTGTTTAVIDLDGKTEITLIGVAAADISASDFDFV